MTKYKINWRTFDDDGAVNRQWNSPATPAFFIIDHKGTIQRKWIGKPGEKSVAGAVVQLVQEAEAAAAAK